MDKTRRIGRVKLSWELCQDHDFLAGILTGCRILDRRDDWFDMAIEFVLEGPDFTPLKDLKEGESPPEYVLSADGKKWILKSETGVHMPLEKWFPEYSAER